jgi:hypothetical protein
MQPNKNFLYLCTKLRTMRRIYIFLFFILISICSQAQNFLVFDTSTYNIGVINSLTGSINISDSIYDNDTSYIYYGNISFGARVNSHIADNSQFNYHINTTDNLFKFIPGQRYPVSFTIHDSTPPAGGFIMGPNTIVIWPVYHRGGSPFGPVDSIYIHATYDTLTGLAGTSLLKMFVFQTTGRLNINFGDAENLVQQVRIFDVLGKSIYAGPPDQSKNIPTAGWNTGIYLCEILTFTGEKRTIKFRME